MPVRSITALRLNTPVSASLASAAHLAEGMRDAISHYVFAAPVNRSITASFGISANAIGTDFDTAYGLADAALYRAKRAGRNRVEFADQ